MSLTANQKSVRTCCHQFPDGHRCGSPAVRYEPFCYFHDPERKSIREHEGRRRRRAFTVATPRNQHELQQSINQVIQGLASNQIDPRRAGLILFALQIAAPTL